jgi:peptidoglycan/xylan/chitin deacetylase (PgdA/CDA1 family)
MSRQLRQMLVGLLALPLSALPFLAYGLLTPEGRLLRDRLIVAVSPPKLPALSAEQLQAAATGAPRYEGRAMALVYHGVGSSSDAEGGFVVSPRRFGEHLATLRAAGMQAVTATDVARASAGGTPLPDNAILITFDDGRADALMFADPLLDEAAMKATMFLISSATDRPNLYYAGWDRIEDAARSGRWDIQAHTHDSHRESDAAGGARLPVLTSLAPGESLAEYQVRIAGDLDRNDAAIEAHVGRRPVAFAYPFGAYGNDRSNDPRIREVLRNEISHRYAVAFHQDEQESVPLLDPTRDDRAGLRRLEVGDWSGAELLGRIARAAGTRPVGEGAGAPPAEIMAPPTELVAPPLIDDRPEGPTQSRDVRPARLRPSAPRTVAIGGPTTTTGPPATVTSDPSSTSGTESPPTTTTEPPTTTTTESPTTTTTEPPPTTTTTEPPGTTTTTRPPGSTTTTSTEKPCRGKGGKSCGR